MKYTELKRISTMRGGGGGIIASPKTGKKAAFIAGIALFMCLSLLFAACTESGGVSEDGESEYLPPDKTKTDARVTFKNGWESDLYSGTMSDDPFDPGVITKAVNPSSIPAAVQTTDLNDYKEAKAVYDKIDAEWKIYETKRDNGDEDAEDYKPIEERPVLPVAPTPTLAYFPGSPIDGAIRGSQPEWDYHIFAGWKIYPNYPSDDGAYELKLDTEILVNLTAVAQWTDGPAKPYYTVTFEKNDGSGGFEKRLAIPQSVNEAGSTFEEKYSDFKLADKDIEGNAFAGNDSPPVFEREHWNAGAWTVGSTSTTYSSAQIKAHPFTEDTFVYQQWDPKKYTINFDSNGVGGTIAALNSTLPNIDATKASKLGGVSNDGKHLPSFAGTATTGNGGNYVFTHWSDAEEGGNKYTDTTPITSDGITLFAQWKVAGASVYTYLYTGKGQIFKAPEAGTYTIEVWGASGGGNKSGKGGYSRGEIVLEKNKQLFVYVGQQGVQGQTGNNPGAGGWNGGGKGGKSNPSTCYSGSGGGGASDVRLVGAATAAWNSVDGLKSRIIVAAGGGGGIGAWSGAASNQGGAGGGASGGNGLSNVITIGATQTTGGAFGIGANGGDANNGSFGSEGRGGGGGGYYGGNAKTSGTGNNTNAAGAGGSSFVSGLGATSGDSTKTTAEVYGYTFTNASTIAGQNTGNGKVVITFTPAAG